MEEGGPQAEPDALYPLVGLRSETPETADSCMTSAWQCSKCILGFRVVTFRVGTRHR